MSVAVISVDELASRVEAYQPEANLELVRDAYVFSCKSHEGQLRKSGDPYFIHPASVAGIIADLRLDVASVCAALLHDVVEDTSVTEEEIEERFGTEISFLVDGVTKLSKINFTSRQDRQAESFRKMVVAMARDIRVLVVKLCDRLDNMRTLEHMSAEGQERIARETMEIYAPLANRLGFARFKNELQDLSFQYLEPDSYESVSTLVEQSAGQRERHISKVCQQLQAKLAQQGFATEVSGRAKHIYSIHRKMETRQCGFEQVYDLIAFRVKVESVADCYAALGVVHSMWTPVPGRFKDYIALPKPNMYQSLHTTVFGPGNQRVEIQIRTSEMHHVAEHGIAAHWKYKSNNSGGLDPKDAARFAWLRQLMESQTELKDPAEFLESVKVDLFQDEVYVFTPKGDVKAFPRGATTLDFAYSIHTEIGDHYTGARVNGAVAPIGYQLHNGDLVEVQTNPDQLPRKEWLSSAITTRALSKIRTYLRSTQRSKSHRLGRELLEKTIHKAGMSLARLEKSKVERDDLLSRFDLLEMRELFVAVGYGKVKPRQVLDALAPEAPASRPGSAQKRTVPALVKEGRIEAFVRKVTGRTSHGILLNGADDVLVRYTKCCNPLPGDEIVGFMTRGRGITVHRRNCPKAFEADPERRVDISWDLNAKINRPVKLTITTANRPGILSTVGHAFHEKGINISEATCRAGEDGRASNTFTFLCEDLVQLKGVMRDIKKIDGVVDVDRI